MKNIKFASATFKIGSFESKTLSLSQCWKVMKSRIGMTQMTSPVMMHGSGILNFLTSAKNNRPGRLQLGDVEMLNKNDGKVYKLIRRFYQKQANTLENTSTWKLCKKEGKKPLPYVEDDVHIRYEYISEPLVLDYGILRCIEENKAQYENDAIQQHLHDYLRNFASAVSKVVATEHVGVHPGNIGTNGVIELPVLNAAGNQFNPAGIVAMEHYLEQAGANPADACLIGNSGKLSTLTKLGRFLSCSSCSAVDNAAISSEYNGIILKDAYVGRLLGDPDCVLAITPGAIKLVTQADWVGDFEVRKESVVKTTFVDPWFGLRHNVLMQEDDCEKDTIKYIQYGINFDVFGYPTCWTNDPCYAGVTDVFKFKITCSDKGACDLQTLDNCFPIADANPRDLSCETNTVVCQKPCNALLRLVCNDDGSRTFNALASCGATGAVITNMKFEFENGYVVEGVPTDELAIEGVTGTINNFTITDLALIGDSQDVVLTITDSAGNTCQTTSCATCEPTKEVNPFNCAEPTSTGTLKVGTLSANGESVVFGGDDADGHAVINDCLAAGGFVTVVGDAGTFVIGVGSTYVFDDATVTNTYNITEAENPCGLEIPTLETIEQVALMTINCYLPA